MPHITSAMRWSIRRGVGDILLDSLLGERSITGEVDNVKNTFSSWDNCMAKTYCKWPVIAAIIVGGLIVFSVLWCIIRCACCGMSCCCTCFSFLKCCDCCGGCCDGKKDKPHKYKDDDPFSSAPPLQGYRAPPPMMGGGLGSGPPQYAQFEVGKNGLAVTPAVPLNEDALPPMPSWETAAKKHVLTEEEKNAVELGELDPATGQKIPLMAGGAGGGISAPPSPMHEMGASPYGAHPGQGVNGNGYMDAQNVDQYNQNQSPQHHNNGAYGAYDQSGNGYRGATPDQTMAGRGYNPNAPMGSQGRGYGPQSPQDPYMSDNAYSGAPVGGAYGRGQPRRQNTGDTNQPYPPQPQRQYSNDSSRPPMQGRGYSDRPYPADNYQQSDAPRYPSSRGPGFNRMASPPLENNAGFDFGTENQQYPQRPIPSSQQISYGSAYGGSTAPPTYASRSPPPQDMNYRPYQTPSNGRRGPPPNLMPGGGRGDRQPENWDPVQR